MICLSLTEGRLLEVLYSPASHSLVGKEGRLAADSRSSCSLGVASLLNFSFILGIAVLEVKCFVSSPSFMMSTAGFLPDENSTLS